MQYLKASIKTTEQATADILIAMLADIGYDGFEETDTHVLAYIEEPRFDKEALNELANDLGVVYEIATIPAQNWNALWESNFEPVIVPGLCTVRAHFHDIAITTPYEIIITPKMSFGTGHHATTQLMMQMMKDIDLTSNTVLDFGTGTGVLAILAELLGAVDITAIDNDEWSVENAIENVGRNNCHHISVALGSLEAVKDRERNVIIANINRHILLQYMDDMYVCLAKDGTLLMSGLLKEDEHIVRNAATEAGFTFQELKEQNNWIAMSFKK